MKKRILILAPHTDDGEIGCGGTIARYLEDTPDVFYLAASTCKRSLPKDWPTDTLEVEVKNAEITLRGKVNEKFEKRLAEDLAASVTGVNNVENLIRVQKSQMV